MTKAAARFRKAKRLGCTRAAASSGGSAARRRASGASPSSKSNDVASGAPVQPQFLIAPAQALVRRQTRQQGGFAAVVEFVVDQRDKLGVIIEHGLLVQPSYFSFASAARPEASLLMIVPIGTPSAAAASA